MIKLTQIPQPERCKYEINVHYKVFPQDRNGNTYHRVKIGFYIGDEWIGYDSGVTYGYEEAYKDTAYRWLIDNIQLTGEHEKGRKQVNTLGIAPRSFFRTLQNAKYLEITFTPVDYLTRKK